MEHSPTTATPLDARTLRLRWMLALVALILLWLGADELQTRSQRLHQQVELALKRIERSAPAALAARKAEAQRLGEQRHAILARLRTDEDEQMTRARLVYDLRKKCDAVPVVCRIRLADLSAGLAAARPANAASAADGNGADLEALGVGRARAVLSGSFKDEELSRLYASFSEDERAQWRLNAVVVRNNNFELDVERLVLYGAPPAAQGEAR